MKSSSKSMMAIWGSSSEEFNSDSIDEISLMAVGDSNSEDDDNTEDCVKRSKQKWYMDSACSRHIIGDKLNFHSFIDMKRGSVDFENGLKRRIYDLEKIDNLVIGGTMDETCG
ncbi:hypothetical protein HAX54_050499 [Datura stramonium]|uniref:Uncharacterized protein n=1 Tax=Datura stramonium TaxID=4076 RepID=A0ABS8WLI0_DATST|nr:hypothetical protein [Datura stramonium]